MIGVIPVIEGAVLAVMLRSLLRLEAAGQRDLGRLALVAGAALAFVTVAIPLQLEKQWITIGWALEGVALAWLYTRIAAPRSPLLPRWRCSARSSSGWRSTLTCSFTSRAARCGSSTGISTRTWSCAAAPCSLPGGSWRKPTIALPGRPPVICPARRAGVVLLFLLLNIEIADFYAVGPTDHVQLRRDASPRT